MQVSKKQLHVPRHTDCGIYVLASADGHARSISNEGFYLILHRPSSLLEGENEVSCGI